LCVDNVGFFSTLLFPGCPATCERFIDQTGLKTLFGQLMHPVATNKQKRALQLQAEEHLLSMITSLFLSCNDVRYLRTLNKFQEENFTKTNKLIELFVQYSQRVSGST
jgi:hypothetical protein